jgi:hypothetical protein
LLLLALWVCIQEWRGNFGSVLWFGWLTVAALALIFTLAIGRQEEEGKRHSRRYHKGHHVETSEITEQLENTVAFVATVSGEVTFEAETSAEMFSEEDAGNAAKTKGTSRASLAVRRQVKHGLIWGTFIFLPCFFLLSAWKAEPWSVLREDAVQGTVGPWAFTLAETETTAPKVGGSGVVMKAFTLCFADDAQSEIRAAYLRARKPRSLRAAGIAFEGNHLRTATIVIPPAFQMEEQIWLTVEGRNGEVHHAALDVSQLSPALARFFAGKEPAQESRKGRNATLSCWNEATEVVCQGATFGSGETRFMDGTTIEVSDENDKILLSARLNRKGEIRFPHPAGKFHVLMEEGPGQTIELNWRDVAARRTAEEIALEVVAGSK